MRSTRRKQPLNTKPGSASEAPEHVQSVQHEPKDKMVADKSSSDSKLPWDSADPRAQLVGFDSLAGPCPGRYYRDSLMSVILIARKLAAGGRLELIFVLLKLLPAVQGSYSSASGFFQDVANRLRFLENYKPTAGDFAVEALQDAFVGMMQNEYDWGKKGFPTKGKVIGMAKELLGRQKISRETGWTDLLRKARLYWLPEGPAGRPKKREVDEIAKAKQGILSIAAKTYGGNIVKAYDAIKASFGRKQDYQKDEAERLAEDGRLSLSGEEDDKESE
jgi:hypothetical protein